jgi:hypothetical protein
VTSPENVELIIGQNWLRVLEDVQGGRSRDGREHEGDERDRQGLRERPVLAPRQMHAAAAVHGSCCC